MRAFSELSSMRIPIQVPLAKIIILIGFNHYIHMHTITVTWPTHFWILLHGRLDVVFSCTVRGETMAWCEQTIAGVKV